MSLRYQIAATITALAALVLVLVLAITLSLSVRATEHAVERNRATTLALLQDLARRPLLTHEYGEIQPYLERMTQAPHVTDVRVLDDSGRVIAASDHAEIGSRSPAMVDGTESVWGSLDVGAVGGRLGSVAIRFSNAQRREAYADARNVGVLVAALGLGAIAFVGLLLGFLLTRRLGQTADAARRLSAGDFSARVGLQGADEVSAVGRAFDAMAEHLAEQVESLRRGEERYRTLLDQMADLVQVTSPTGEVLLTNRAWRETLLGGQDATTSGLRFADMVRAEDREAASSALSRVVAEGIRVNERLVLACAEGQEVIVEACFTRLYQNGGALALAVMRDVTVTERLTQEIGRKDDMLIQAQRLESLGRLAGGVAHDFNNILTVIAGEAEEMRTALGAEHPLRASALQVESAVERATALTRQLLTFARRHKSQPELFELNAAVRDLEPMLRRLISEDVSLLVRLPEPSPVVRADPVQMQQVLVNLIVNARDAMPGGGTLTIETGSELRPDEEQAAAPIRYATLSVSDTGLGMDENTRERAFDPFFTTKAPGRGTGLGLSIVHGIVRGAGGLIELRSAPRAGSRIMLLLPASDEQVRAGSESAAPAAVADARGETILVVEDEDAVRTVIVAILTRAGYRVLETRDPANALTLAASANVDLLLSDVVMPGLSGPELGRRLRERVPALPLLFVSGYSDGNTDFLGATLLAKPFTRGDLLTRVREALDRAGAAPA